MQDLFKSKLLELRSPTAPQGFGDALLGKVLWGGKAVARKTITAVEEGVKLKEAYSEKKQVIESLERFVEDQTKESKISIIPVAGGEITLKKPEEHELAYRISSLDELTKFISAEAFSEFNNLIKNKKPGKLAVLFITESFRETSEREVVENASPLVASFLPCLPHKTSELFEKMVTAMKLNADETLLLGLESKGEDLLKAVMSVADHLKPEVIITLGAKSTQRVLKSPDRLTMVHGQFFQRKIGDWTAQIVPLFHPSIIETNLNMKKTAWIDMQKIMKWLKKI